MLKSHLLLLGLSLSVTSQCFTQDMPELPQPQKEHEWLQQFVGQWETEAEATMGPGQPAMKCTSTMKARMLGGFWMVAEVNGDAMGTQISAFQTIGYDPQTKKYVGTWVDSMASHMWKYEGTVDATGKTLTLEAEGPNFMVDGKLAKFRDVYEFRSKDEIASMSQILGDDGQWIAFMTGRSKRVQVAAADAK